MMAVLSSTEASRGVIFKFSSVIALDEFIAYGTSGTFACGDLV
jgi:hypothetical protein